MQFNVGDSVIRSGGDSCGFWAGACEKLGLSEKGVYTVVYSDPCLTRLAEFNSAHFLTGVFSRAEKTPFNPSDYL